MQNIENPPLPVIEQQVKGWLLSPTIWFFLAVGATLLDFLSSTLSALAPKPQTTSGGAVAQTLLTFLFALVWLGLKWLVVWKRWSHAGIRRKRYLGWTYGQGAFVFLSCIGVLFSLLAS